MRELISILIPVYNTQPYLKKCLESVLAQTYRELEILLIDDGSTDGSLKTCLEYSERDSRIEVISSAHIGVGATRNLAVRKARGEYLAFIDSDDFVDRNYIETLYGAVQKYNTPIAASSYCKVHSETIIASEEETEEDQILYQKEIMKELVKDTRILSNVAMKLIKKEVFQGIEFPEGCMYEDLAVSYKLFLKAGKMVYTTGTKYYYVYRKRSISNQSFVKGSADLYFASKELLNFLQCNYPEFVREQRWKCIKVASSVLQRMIASGNIDAVLEAELRDEVASGIWEFLGSGYSGKDKLLAALEVWIYPVFKFIRKRVGRI